MTATISYNLRFMISKATIVSSEKREITPIAKLLQHPFQQPECNMQKSSNVFKQASQAHKRGLNPTARIKPMPKKLSSSECNSSATCTASSSRRCLASAILD